MKIIFIISFFILLVLKFLSCSKIYPDDKFTLSKQENNSNLLKLEGYYYFGDEKNIYDSYFFYNDGILFNGLGSPPGENSFELLEEIFKLKVKNNNIQGKANKQYWGLYEINGDEIKFERYYPSSGGPLPAYIRSGKILNDTTFVITQSMRSNGTGVQVKNETYHFRQFSPKPDSTNNFIK